MQTRSYIAIAHFVLLLLSPIAFAAPLLTDPDQQQRSDVDEQPDAPPEETDDVLRETLGLSVPEDSKEGKSIRLAVVAFQRGDVDECLSNLKTAVATQPTLPPPRIILAGFHLRKGELDDARALLEAGAARGTKHPQLYVSLAKLAMREDRLADAEVHFDKLESLEIPSKWTESQRVWLSTGINIGRAAIAERREQWEEARRNFAQLSQQHPQAASWKVRQARAALFAGKEEEAFDVLDIAYRQQPSLGMPELMIGVMYTQKRDYEAAESWYQKALEKESTDTATRSAYLMALLYQGKASEAQKQLEGLESLGVDAPLLEVQQGIIARMQGDLSTAKTHLLRAVEQTPENEEAQYQLIMTLAALPDPDAKQEAANRAKQFAEEHPGSPLALTALGAVQHASGDFAEAEQTLQKAMSVPHYRPETLYIFGRVLAAQRKTAEAQKVAEALRERLDEPNVFVLREAARRWLESVDARAAKAD